MPDYQKIQVPGLGNLEFPADMPDEEIRSEINRLRQEELGQAEPTTQERVRENIMRPIFPSATESLEQERGLGRTAAAFGADVLSQLGRAIASLPALAPGGETFGEALERTRAKEKPPLSSEATGFDVIGRGLGTFGENVLRSPATAASALAAPLAAPIRGGTGLAALGRSALAGAVESVPPAIAGQLEKYGEGEDIDLQEAFAEIATGAGLSALGEGIKQAGKPLFNAAIKPDKAARLKGFKAENIIKHKLEGSFENVVKKSQQKISEADALVDDILEKVSKENPAARIDLQDLIIKFVDDVDAGKVSSIAIDDEDAAMVAAEKLLERFEKRGINKPIDLSKARDVKKVLAFKAFPKGANIMQDPVKKQVKEILNIRLNEKLKQFAPEIAEQNKIMSEIIPIKEAARAAIERTGNRNTVLNLRSLMSGIGLKSVGLGDTEAILGGIAAERILGGGRGPASVTRLGRGIGSTRYTQPIVSELIGGKRNETDDEIVDRLLSKTPGL